MEKLLGNSNQNNPNLRLSQKQPTKVKKKPIKIKYISSPMLVRANNASEFRAIVQELTGRNSNVSDLYDDVHNIDYSQIRPATLVSDFLDADQPRWPFPAHHHGPQGSDDIDDHHLTLVHDHVDEKFPNPAANVSLLAQIDHELGHYLRSEVSESFNNGFQSPCVFVGQN